MMNDFLETLRALGGKLVPQFLKRARLRRREFRDFDSAAYWEQRYHDRGNSGAGSYGRLALFKAEVINKFIADKNIRTVIEFGVGDGNQLKLLNVPQYTGFDVSETILDKVRETFKDDASKSFLHTRDFKTQTADLAMSLDVIYHLVEDPVFEKYMTDLFSGARKYVIIYSSNCSKRRCLHVLHREFTNWVSKNRPDWRLIEKIPNRYPFSEADQANTSFADFYIFEKVR